MTETKVCKRCSTEKPLTEFYQQGKYYRSYCKECDKVKATEWNKANPERYAKNRATFYVNNAEKVKANVAEYHRLNPLYGRHNAARQRAREAGAVFEDVDLAKVFANSDGICGVCGLFVDIDNGHLDHIVPLVRGGHHVETNVQITHPSCNNAKYDKVGWSIYAAA